MAYKRELIAKTKNLFNVNALTPYTPETLPEGWAGVYQGQIIARCIVGSSVANSYKTFKELCPTAIAGEQYFLHFNTNGTGGTANRIWFESSERAWINGTRLVLTETDLNSRVYFYANYPERTVATISNFQIEKGSTATDYVPYGSLTSYKKLLKVSDVCQLLDKRTFETRSEGGTTATYNNDGTFTVSGTATVNSWKNFPVFQLSPNGGTHVYLFDVGSISNSTTTSCHIYFYDERTDRAVSLVEAGGTAFATIKRLAVPQAYQARFNITTLVGATPNNIVYKPQLFDLTEMYGAGNEPKTVEEFRTKFPNDLYDYSPRCWVKSYKTELVVNNGKTI